MWRREGFRSRRRPADDIIPEGFEGAIKRNRIFGFRWIHKDLRFQYNKLCGQPGRYTPVDLIARRDTVST